MQSVTDTRERRCIWCELPPFGPEGCACRSPKFELMDQCEACGTWREVDHLHLDYDSEDERVVCTGRCLP